MNLYCLKCHTKWTEQVLVSWQKCPFVDCDGKLSPVAPSGTVKPRPKREKPTYPLLDETEHDA